MASTTSPGTIKQFDLYWVDLEPTLGSEIRKVRPAIIVSPDIMNQTLRTVLVVPLTHTIVAWPWRIKLHSTDQLSSAACDHMRSVDIRRLKSKIGRLAPNEQQLILAILQQLFAS